MMFLIVVQLCWYFNVGDPKEVYLCCDPSDVSLHQQFVERNRPVVMRGSTDHCKTAGSVILLRVRTEKSML
jgi:hypothetical protein